MTPTDNVLTVQMVLGAAATVLMALCTVVLRTIWSEIKEQRKNSQDHALLLQAHEGRLDNHDEDLGEIKRRIFNGNGGDK